MKKLNVFLTIDTELWLLYNNFEKDLSSAIYGKTNEGEFGLKFQLETFKQYNLKAYFFVDPLFSLRYGKKYLKDIVELIDSYDQYIGLHIHTEWLKPEDTDVILNARPLNNINEYTLSEQKQIINKGLSLLAEAGAKSVDAFRAGNYGASFETLTALKDNGILFDTSYNHPYLNNPCNMQTPRPLSDITNIEEVFEFPVTYFNDYSDHLRHLQLTACSINELKFVINECWKQERSTCTIVLHSFEWIKRIKNSNGQSHKLDQICLARFVEMCRFLSENSNKYTTTTYQEATSNKKPNTGKLIKSNILRTAGRFYQQLKRRL